MGAGKDNLDKERGTTSGVGLSRQVLTRLPASPGSHSRPAHSFAANQEVQREAALSSGFLEGEEGRGEVMARKEHPLLSRPTACPRPPGGLGCHRSPLCSAGQKPPAGSSNSGRADYVGTSGSLATVFKPW